MKKTLLQPPNFPRPRGHYSHGVLLEAGGVRTLYATGQLAVDVDGRVVAPDDATAQSEFVFGLIGQILAAAGMTFDHVVRTQTFLTNMADFPKFSVVRNRYLAGAMPASTLLEVKGLAFPGCCVEVEITAVQ